MSTIYSEWRQTPQLQKPWKIYVVGILLVVFSLSGTDITEATPISNTHGAITR